MAHALRVWGERDRSKANIWAFEIDDEDVDGIFVITSGMTQIKFVEVGPTLVPENDRWFTLNDWPRMQKALQLTDIERMCAAQQAIESFRKSPLKWEVRLANGVALTPALFYSVLPIATYMFTDTSLTFGLSIMRVREPSISDLPPAPATPPREIAKSVDDWIPVEKVPALDLGRTPREIQIVEWPLWCIMAAAAIGAVLQMGAVLGLG